MGKTHRYEPTEEPFIEDPLDEAEVLDEETDNCPACNGEGCRECEFWGTVKR